jgi:gamma-glutamylcyclotransferase (GGCT)/AIG2-like uncharacterized protein YtfP
MTKQSNERAVTASEPELALARILAADPGHRLFVYGTLMERAAGDYGRAARIRLEHEAEPHRLAATTQGQLYQLGRYPGLVAGTGPDSVVHGELMLLSDPAVTLPWLDEYEAILPDQHPDNEYVRTLREVMINGGQIVDAWAYLFVKPTTGLPRIEAGRWMR